MDVAAKESSDIQIIKRIQGGDVGAYGELLKRHQHTVYGIVSGMIYNKDDTDDVVQDVFIQAYKYLKSFRGDCAFSTWIYRIAVNTSIKHIKKKKNRLGISIDDPETGLGNMLKSANDDCPESVIENNEKNEALRNAVKTLPDKHRIVVVLRYFRDMSCEEIAGVLDCSVGTVWSRLHYACLRLQSQLGWFVGENEI